MPEEKTKAGEGNEDARKQKGHGYPKQKPMPPQRYDEKQNDAAKHDSDRIEGDAAFLSDLGEGSRMQASQAGPKNHARQHHDHGYGRMVQIELLFVYARHLNEHESYTCERED